MSKLTTLQMVREVGRLSNLIRRRMDIQAAKVQYSGAENRALHFILVNQDRPVYQKTLEDNFSWRASTVSELIVRMEKDGLITREQDPDDARKKRVIPTEKGRAKLVDIQDEMQALEDDLINGISKEDLDTFYKVLSSMVDNLS